MPKTKQSAMDRKAYVANREDRDTRAIAKNSPDSETKDQMKARIMARQRVAYGDGSGLSDVKRKTKGSSY